jgi:hypothetical protein
VGFYFLTAPDSFALMHAFRPRHCSFLDVELTAVICLINYFVFCNVFLFFNGCRFQFWPEHLLDLIEKHLTTRSTPSFFLSLRGLLLLITVYFIMTSLCTEHIEKGDYIDKS